MVSHTSLTAKSWGKRGAHLGPTPMLAPWTLLSGLFCTKLLPKLAMSYCQLDCDEHTSINLNPSTRFLFKKNAYAANIYAQGLFPIFSSAWAFPMIKTLHICGMLFIYSWARSLPMRDYITYAMFPLISKDLGHSVINTKWPQNWIEYL